MFPIFATLALALLPISEPSKQPLVFKSVSDCSTNSDSSIDFSGLKLSKDRKYVEGTVVVKNEIQKTPVTIDKYLKYLGYRWKGRETKANYCLMKFRPTPDFTILKKGLGTKCPIKKGTKKIKVPAPKGKQDTKIGLEAEVRFPDNSCLHLELETKNKYY